jgi:predicted secreted protein
METEEEINLKQNESFKVSLESRGATGLKLMYHCDTNMVQIQKVDTEAQQQRSQSIGDPVPVTYEIKALKEGQTKVVFYETKPWDKNFKELVKKVFNISIH